ncbi:hypothetical protein GWK47_017772 [Chionoecetes opilio]|uniref:RNase H type-1 domain-containing protein n=1 Tax=Chionoecetes opilio TaxID=41210 RepID=A0A8J4XRL5_CHIOP|nr:hypothetical protein GWK47_017772 [Chionoecetes opilio]
MKKRVSQFLQVSASGRSLKAGNDIGSNATFNAILEWLYLLKRRGRTVSFCWVPAHVGVAGSEEADALAKAAARRPALSHFAVPATDLRSAIHRSVHTSWQERWNNIGQNKLAPSAKVSRTGATSVSPGDGRLP